MREGIHNEQLAHARCIRRSDRAAVDGAGGASPNDESDETPDDMGEEGAGEESTDGADDEGEAGYARSEPLPLGAY